MNKIYQRITELCAEQNTSYSKVCRLLGFSASSIGNMVGDDNRSLRAENALALAEFFDVSVAYLLGLTDDRHGSKKPATSGDGLSEFEAAVLSADERQRQLIMRVLSLPAEQQDAFLTMTQSFQTGQ